MSDTNAWFDCDHDCGCSHQPCTVITRSCSCRASSSPPASCLRPPALLPHSTTVRLPPHLHVHILILVCVDDQLHLCPRLRLPGTATVPGTPSGRYVHLVSWYVYAAWSSLSWTSTQSSINVAPCNSLCTAACTPPTIHHHPTHNDTQTQTHEYTCKTDIQTSR